MQVRNDIHWVGYIDRELREFHGYLTPYGSTYNAYLIVDEKPTIIDTVKHYGFDEMLGRIKEVIDPSKIEYIISNHTEMDHSGGIGALLEYCPGATVVCSPKGEEELKRHFKKQWAFKAVNTGDTLSIGARTLSFVLMPMVHWPDSMATYSVYDRVLFPNDAFGQHYASDERYADEVDAALAYREAAKYYANIVMPYGAQVGKALEAIKPLAVDVIAPSHGLIWRTKQDIDKITASYAKWARHETEKKAVIVYDTMWHSTETMATRLHTLLRNEGIPAVLLSLRDTHISDVVTEILASKVAVFGSPILNNHILPSMAALVMYLKGLRPKGRYAMTIGSYGWAAGGFKEFEESLAAAGFELLDTGKYIQFVPDEEELQQLSDAAVTSIKNALG